MTQEAVQNQLVGEADLVVNLEGFAGPIDLLLTLAREQKVDLGKISILALANQYISYIQEAKKLHLEIAADYLVMAAWLAYLKSRLLLPEEKEAEQPAEVMAELLRFHMRRLEAMQQVARSVQELPQLNKDVFLRGFADELKVIVTPQYYLNVGDLLVGLSASYRRRTPPAYALPLDKMMTIEGAMSRLRNIVGQLPEWTSLTDYLPDMFDDPLVARAALASTFAATLELVRLGEIELQQDGLFKPIMMRRRQNPQPAEGDVNGHTSAAA